MTDPITQSMMHGAAGASGDKLGVEDVFSTYVYRGNAGTQAIDNGIDLAGEGGMVWIKRRDGTNGHRLTDTVRGATKAIVSESDSAETTEANGLTAFNNNGFTLGDSDYYNGNNNTLSSWSFRKQEGFFDVVTFTETGSNLTVSHNLGCVPGMILMKRTNGTSSWWVYHKEMGQNALLRLDRDIPSTDMSGSDYGGGGWCPVTSTTFTFKPGAIGYGAGTEYVAYLFAGGASTAATAKSVSFSGSDGTLAFGSTSDFKMGTGAFTVEAWVYYTDISTAIQLWDGRPNSTSGNYLNIGLTGPNGLGTVDCAVPGGSAINCDRVIPKGKWTHIAVVREGTGANQCKIYYDGTLEKTGTNAADYNIDQGGRIIAQAWIRGNFTGKVSNLRIVKGTAVYTSSFKPPTEPLTNISGTVLLCCNDSSSTGSTVTPGTITASGSAAASTDSPFDDPAAFTFGENEDQNIIKCGSYIGNGTTAGLEIDLGFEPQWVLFKNAGSTYNWRLYDSIRGIVSGGNDSRLMPNLNIAEESDTDKLELTPTGFKIVTNNNDMNENAKKIIFTAIRRPDGYVGKPAEVGTDAFAMDVGGNTPLPCFAANFPADYVLTRDITSTAEMYSAARLMSKEYLVTQTNASEVGSNAFVFDYNLGCCGSGLNNTFRAWMWKRGAGFDVVTYKGNAVQGRQVPHSLNAVPEMMWVKNRNSGEQWYVYHKDNSSTPATKALNLNSNGTSQSGNWLWDATMPTSTVFTLGNDGSTNGNNSGMIAMLFSSVTGISKVGSWTGNGDVNGQTITTGFQPRFLIFKNRSGAGDWYMLDTARGWASGNDNYLRVNTTAANQTDANFGEPTSTGFTIRNDNPTWNENNAVYIYYAHA